MIHYGEDAADARHDTRPRRPESGPMDRSAEIGHPTMREAANAKPKRQIPMPADVRQFTFSIVLQDAEDLASKVRGLIEEVETAVTGRELLSWREGTEMPLPTGGSVTNVTMYGEPARLFEFYRLLQEGK